MQAHSCWSLALFRGPARGFGSAFENLFNRARARRHYKSQAEENENRASVRTHSLWLIVYTLRERLYINDFDIFTALIYLEVVLLKKLGNSTCNSCFNRFYATIKGESRLPIELLYYIFNI